MSVPPAIIIGSTSEESPSVINAETFSFDTPSKSRANSTSEDGIIRRTSSRHVAGTYIHENRRRTRTHSELSLPQSLPQTQQSMKGQEIIKEGGLVIDSAATVPVDDATASETARVFHAYVKKDPQLRLHKLVYLLICAGLAAYTPFTGLYLKAAGADERDIGMIQAFRPFCILFVTPMWTRLADSGRRRQVLIATTLFSTIFRACAAMSTSVGAVGAFVVLGDIFGAPVYSLLDAAILSLLEMTSSTTFYGNTRLFGSTGWGGFAPVAGMIADKYGLHATTFALVGFLVPAIFLCSKVPVELEKATAESNKGIGAVFKRTQVVLFLFVVFIMVSTTNVVMWATPLVLSKGMRMRVQGMMASMMGNFLFLFYQNLGASKSLMGLALTFTCISEVPMFFVSTKILKKFGVTAVLFCSMTCYFIRLLCYSQLTVAAWTLPIELFHGFTFALGWAAATKFMHEAVPHELASTAQGILSAVFNGLGACCGAFIGGLLFSTYGPHTLYAVGACCALVGMVPLGLSVHLARKQRKAEAHAAGTVASPSVDDPAKFTSPAHGPVFSRTEEPSDPAQLTFTSAQLHGMQPALFAIREAVSEEEDRIQLTERYKSFLSRG